MISSLEIIVTCFIRLIVNEMSLPKHSFPLRSCGFYLTIVKWNYRNMLQERKGKYVRRLDVVFVWM
jgi:hypothetical protein